MFFWTVLSSAALLAVGLAGCVRPGAEVAALQRSVRALLPQLEQRLCLNAGGFTFGTARLLGWMFQAPAEPRAALRTVRGVNVAIFDPGALLTNRGLLDLLKHTDAAMSGRGWERAVLFRDQDRTVAIYVPEKLHPAEHLRACAMLIESGQIILASAKADLAPLMELAGLKRASVEPTSLPTRHIADDRE